MGVGLIPFYDIEVPQDVLYNGDGKGLAQDFEALNEIAAAAGLRALRDFAENEFEEYMDVAGLPELTYHPINEGLGSIDGLLREIRSRLDIASRLADPADTIEELEELARSLRAAESGGAQFCLFFM